MREFFVDISSLLFVRRP